MFVDINLANEADSDLGCSFDYVDYFNPKLREGHRAGASLQKLFFPVKRPSDVLKQKLNSQTLMSPSSSSRVRSRPEAEHYSSDFPLPEVSMIEE